MEPQTIEKGMEKQEPIAVWAVAKPKKPTGTCCFCIPLRIACFCLGYSSLITNLFNTFSIAWSLLVIGIGSHGFDSPEDGMTPEDEVEQAEMNNLTYVLGITFMMDFAWLMVSVYLLVGLHLRRPGFIKVKVAIATIRFIFIVYSIAANNDDYSLGTIMTLSFELGLYGYFIIVYYVYAKQLEREIAEEKLKRQNMTDIPEISIIDHFVYPKQLEIQHLVEKERF